MSVLLKARFLITTCTVRGIKEHQHPNAKESLHRHWLDHAIVLYGATGSVRGGQSPQVVRNAFNDSCTSLGIDDVDWRNLIRLFR